MDLFELLVGALRTAVGPEAAVLALAAVGLNVHFGYTGLLNLGQVGYMMVGAYGVAITVATFGLPLWVGLFVAVGLSLMLTLLLGAPTLRLRADYFAIASIAVTETLRLLVRSNWLEPVTGGVIGLNGFSEEFYSLNPIAEGRYALGPLQWTADQLYMTLSAWTSVVMAVLLVWLIIQSPWGRVVRAIKGDEDAPRSLGKPTVRYKMQSLALGGLLGSGAGVLLALHQHSVTPVSYMPVLTFFAYAALIIGGIGKTWGPVLGAVIFWAVLSSSDYFMANLGDVVPSLGLTAQQLAASRFVLVGAGLMLLVYFWSQGFLSRTTSASVRRAVAPSRRASDPPEVARIETTTKRGEGSE